MAKYKNISFLILIFFFQLPQNCISQDVLSKATLRGLDSYIEDIMQQWKIPGLAVAVIYKDKVLYSKGYGYRNIESQQPVGVNTLFAIASCTKAFTAASACLLVEDGLLDLDKPAKQYLPNLQMYDDFTTLHITLRDMLTHRSGLPRHDWVWYYSDKNRAQLVATLKYLQPNSELHEKYQYQNLMFTTAGYIIGEVVGLGWEKLVQERILKPLEMTNTNFSILELQNASDFALPYQKKDGKVSFIPNVNVDALGPAGSINSNIMDMAKWLTMMINKGVYNGKQILSNDSYKQLTTPYVTVPSDIEYEELFYLSYGLGWFITSYSGHLRLSHSGNIDGYSADVSFMPNDSLGVVILTNLYSCEARYVIRNNIYDRLLGLTQVDWNERYTKALIQTDEQLPDDFTKIHNTTPSHKLADYQGKYEHPAYGILDITCSDNQLIGHYHGFAIVFQHYHYDTFTVQLDGETVKFTFRTNEEGLIDGASAFLQSGIDEIMFSRVVK